MIVVVLSAVGFVLAVMLMLSEVRRRAPSPAGGWLERSTARRLVVHTSDDKSLEGTVAMVGDDGMVLTAAKLLGEKDVDLAGEVWVPRGKVVFVQAV